MRTTPCGEEKLYCDGKQCPIKSIWFEKEWDCPAFIKQPKREEQKAGMPDLFRY
ncbi:MAG: hypothetical protein ACP5JR_00055 [Thermoplasmata archaeon]